MKTLDDLTATDSPAWPDLLQSIANATSRVEVLPRDEQRARETLVAIQVTTRSTLGAIAYETGGLLIDHGWIRVLGSGHSRIALDLRDWNGLGGRSFVAAETKGSLIVAHDVVGGFFALDGGALGPGKGGAYYLAPDTLEWEDLERGYTDLIDFFLSGNLERFYAAFRWPGWKDAVAQLAPDQGFHQYPPAWSKESKDADGVVLATVSRKPVPMTELLGVQLSYRAQLLAR